MEEQQFWVIHCKVCGKIHRGDPIIRVPGTYLENVQQPMEGVIECPLNPGQRAEYLGYEWFLLTKSELDSLLDK